MSVQMSASDYLQHAVCSGRHKTGFVPGITEKIGSFTTFNLFVQCKLRIIQSSVTTISFIAWCDVSNFNLAAGISAHTAVQVCACSSIQPALNREHSIRNYLSSVMMSCKYRTLSMSGNSISGSIRHSPAGLQDTGSLRYSLVDYTGTIFHHSCCHIPAGVL